ncbi:MAG: flippase [Patescibacteria group bacterium]|nr:flippase [Patescibacteria group bacterium]
MEIIKKVIQQTSWQLIGKLATALSTFVILGIIARFYGETGVGIYTLALAYLAFFYLATDLGLNSYLLPKINLQDSLLNSLFKLRIFWAIILLAPTLLLVFVLPIGDSDFRKAVIVGLPTIVTSAILFTTSLIFQKALHFEKVAIASLIGSVASLSIVFLLAGRAPVYLLLLGPVLAAICSVVVSLSFAQKYYRLNLWHQIKLPLSPFAKAWPISLALVVNTVYFRVDSFILSHYYSLAEVGIYNIAYQIFQTILVIPTFIMNSFYPLIASDFYSSLVSFQKRLNRAGLLLLLISLSGVVLTWLLSPLIIELISGQGFQGSIVALRVLSLSFPAFFITSLLMAALIILNKSKSVALIYSLGLIMNLVLNFVFIPRYSYLAAAWVTVVGEYLILVCQLIILIWSLKNFTVNGRK